MAIKRERKEELVSQYTKVLNQYSTVIFASPSGLEVKQIEGLRKQLREIDSEFFVVKNTLAKLAFEETKTPIPEGSLDGATAIGVTSEDVPGMAKLMVDLSREFEVFAIKGAVIDGAAVSAEEVQRLADLPPLPVVQAQLLGLLNAPARNLAGVVNSSVRQVVTVIKAYSDTEAAASA